jgi:hypothetical protein
MTTILAEITGLSSSLVLPKGEYWARITSTTWGEAILRVNDAAESGTWQDASDLIDANNVFVLPGNASYRLNVVSISTPILLETFLYSTLSDQDAQQIRYRLGMNGETEQPTPPVTDPVTLDPSADPERCNCSFRIIDAITDLPLEGVSISVSVQTSPNILGTMVFSSQKSYLTDVLGEATVPLLRNASYNITVAGSRFLYQVPDEPAALFPGILVRPT